MSDINRTYRKIRLRPKSIDLSGKMSHKIGLAIPFSTLKSSMAND